MLITCRKFAGAVRYSCIHYGRAVSLPERVALQTALQRRFERAPRPPREPREEPAAPRVKRREESRC